MPFLRPVGPPAATPASTEIRSAKTLIGSSPSKCDVVLPPDLGVLDLHALLSLSSEQSSATIVPFSASADGACFLNGRVVPPQGATVVHGDQVAFGNAANAFVFSLTDNASSDPRSLQNSRSFRRALDALRGDRAPVAGFNDPQPTPAPGRPLGTSAGISSSTGQLEKFLREASTDSLLGDFVERKLRNSSNESSRQLRKERHAVLEPPPSIPASAASSFQSFQNDSITGLQRDAVDGSVSKTKSLLSTAERNYAEIEKLRLSQRLREVNNVLNGHLGFESSYLSPQRRSSGAASMELSSPLKTRINLAEAQAQTDEIDEEDEDNDFPAMIEKPKPTKADRSPKRAPQSFTELSAKLLPKSVCDSITITEDASPIDESLPSFSEAIQRKQAVELGDDDNISTDGQRLPVDSLSQQSKTISLNQRVRPPLHQQLIDRTLKRKRHEALAEAFIRWRRGLRIQEQRQRDRRRQIQIVDKKLQLLRRNQRFVSWKRYSEHKQQVLTCREEAFELRRQTRRLRILWSLWVEITMRTRDRMKILLWSTRSFTRRRLRYGFQKWLLRALDGRRDAESIQLRREHQAFIEKRMCNVAKSHHEQIVLQGVVRRMFRSWRRLAEQTMKKKCNLHRILIIVFRRKLFCAWATWKQQTEIHRLQGSAEQLRLRDVQHASDMARQHYETEQKKLSDRYDETIQTLQARIQEQEKKLKAIETDAIKRKQQIADAKIAAKAEWSGAAKMVLSEAVEKADKQIAAVSTRLEDLLQRMDVEPQAARFQAASFLVEATLEQKLLHANELVAAQTELLAAMQDSDPLEAEDSRSSWRKMLASDSKYLLEMVQQRHARLHQLYQAIAKLASTTPHHTGAQSDATRLKHATFLTDAMHERNRSHVDEVAAIHHRRCELGVAAPQARKY